MALLESILAGCIAFVVAAIAGASPEQALVMGALTTGGALLYFGIKGLRK
jgi:hypothetical protein